jgi:2-keto-3-deoxy-L-rhamnonate aldolase RhmA
MLGVLESDRNLRELLRDRAPLAVAFLDLGSPVSAEVTAMSGFDALALSL